MDKHAAPRGCLSIGATGQPCIERRGTLDSSARSSRIVGVLTDVMLSRHKKMHALIQQLDAEKKCLRNGLMGQRFPFARNGPDLTPAAPREREGV
jgi:hypothetical protein